MTKPAFTFQHTIISFLNTKKVIFRGMVSFFCNNILASVHKQHPTRTCDYIFHNSEKDMKTINLTLKIGSKFYVSEARRDSKQS